MKPIDWSSFDQYPEHTCECSCGCTFRSHCKVVSDGIAMHIVTRKPCPTCGKDNELRSARSDPETMTIGR
jgi:hypothetical protein